MPKDETRTKSLNDLSSNGLCWLVVGSIFVSLMIGVLVFESTKTRLSRSLRTSLYPSLLIVVRTMPNRYNYHVDEIKRTWGKLAPTRNDQKVLFVGGKETDGKPDMISTSCADTNTRVNTCCKTAAMVRSAYEMNKNESNRFDWIYFVDDDVKLVADNLQRSLTFPQKPVMKGVLGCTTSKCSGICGGGGILVSKQTLSILIENQKPNFKTFEEELTSKCNYCDGWDDMGLSMIFKADRSNVLAGLDIDQLDGVTNAVDSGKLDILEVNKSLSSRPPAPINIHGLKGDAEHRNITYIAKLADHFRSNEVIQINDANTSTFGNIKRPEQLTSLTDAQLMAFEKPA